MDISGKRMYSLLEKLNFVRLSTCEGEKKAAEIIADEVRNAGVEPIIETFKAPHYEIKTAKFEVTAPYHKEYNVVGYGFSGNAAENGIEADFIYLEAVEPIDIIAGIKGKIALVTGGIGVEAYKKLIEAGVAGFVTTSGTFLDKIDETDIGEQMLRTPFTENGQLPGVTMRISDGIELVASKPERVKITLAQTEGEADSRNVIAEIQGTKYPDEVIVYTAHYDSVEFSHGMFDNASGSAMILEMLRYFKANPPKRTVRFIWCGSEERGLLGSKAYIASHDDLLKNIRLCINIDMAGPLLGRDRATVTGEESLCHAIEYLYKEIGHPMTVNQDIYSSDSIPFADKGIPGVNFVRNAAAGTTQIHCRTDVISQVSAESLESTTKFVAKFSDKVINAYFFPIERKVPDNIVEKVDKYLRKKK